LTAASSGYLPAATVLGRAAVEIIMTMLSVRVRCYFVHASRNLGLGPPTA
jgi:hypothetical protein